jgi:nitroimidazol reductase NimA-like FMN-containing flavoprotein (pyridoxamine 5'-phosphate oxidase superfamily)
MELDSAGLEVLERGECLRLLEASGRGRLGLNVSALPTIMPVRFVIDADTVLLCVQPGTVADKATDGTVVAFQADGVSANGAEWSVTVIGVARHLITADELDRAEAFPLPRWSKGMSPQFVAISTDYITGRRTVD